MAVTLLPRTGAPNWGAGTDPLTRAQLNALSDRLEADMAIDGQGTLAARPAAGKRGRYYWATDVGFLYRDTGSAWSTINAGSPLADAAPPAIGDAGAVGVSTDAAREDHTHALHPQTVRKDQSSEIANNSIGFAMTQQGYAYTYGYVVGDAYNRHTVRASGRQEWGPGNAPGDTTLERSAPGILTGTVCDRIAETILGASATEVIFGSIPQTYRHLLLLAEGALTSSIDDPYPIDLRFNSNTTSNYSYKVSSMGSTALESAVVTDRIHLGHWRRSQNNHAGLLEVLIPGYSLTSHRKTTVSRLATLGQTDASNSGKDGIGWWSGAGGVGGAPEAISTIGIRSATDPFAAGTIFTLYGLR